MLYAASRRKRFVLALFDYTTWSGFATQFFHALREHLLGRSIGFKLLPPELSAIIYLERKVSPDGWSGRIGLSTLRSAVYYNPLTLHPLPAMSFPSLNQFSLQLLSIAPTCADPWIYL